MKRIIFFVLFVAMIVGMTFIQSGKAPQKSEVSSSLDPEIEDRLRKYPYNLMNMSILSALPIGEDIKEGFFPDQVMADTVIGFIELMQLTNVVTEPIYIESGVDKNIFERVVYNIFGRYIKHPENLSGRTSFQKNQYVMSVSNMPWHYQGGTMDISGLGDEYMIAESDNEYYSEDGAKPIPVHLTVIFKANSESMYGYNIVEAKLSLMEECTTKPTG